MNQRRSVSSPDARPDERETKILADILALILEEQPGEAHAALDALRTRAIRSDVTGGALKNLFSHLITEPRSTGPSAMERQLLQRLRRAENELKQRQARASTLNAFPTRLQQDNEDLVLKRSSQRDFTHWRRTSLALCLLTGLLLGIAGSQLVHSLTDRPPVSRPLYFR